MANSLIQISVNSGNLLKSVSINSNKAVNKKKVKSIKIKKGLYFVESSAGTFIINNTKSDNNNGQWSVRKLVNFSLDLAKKSQVYLSQYYDRVKDQGEMFYSTKKECIASL